MIGGLVVWMNPDEAHVARHDDFSTAYITVELDLPAIDQCYAIERLLIVTTKAIKLHYLPAFA